MIPPRRGTIVVENRPPVISWCEIDNFTPALRQVALSRLDRQRRWPIWHFNPKFRQRLMHLPGR